MSLRGEFIRGDGLVVPNNITIHGREFILNRAIRASGPMNNIYFAVVQANPLALTEDDVIEPTHGVNGYSRKQLLRNTADWSLVKNGVDVYVESLQMIWAPTGAGFDKPIQRLAWFLNPIRVEDELVYAVSAPLPEPVTLTPAAAAELLTWKYRIYL